MPVDTGVPFGKYKKVLLSNPEILEEIPKISRKLRELENLQEAGLLQTYEVLTIFILIYLNSRSERYLSRLPKKEITSIPALEAGENSLKIQDLPQILQSLFLNCSTYDTIFEFLIQYRFLKLPGEIQEFLINFAKHKYNIVLTNKDIEPFEMLLLQSSGKRAVTLSFQNAYTGTLIERRDAFEFLLHDISHAYTFFHESYDMNGQVDFFKKILRHFKFFESYKQIKGFEKKFIYLISDMNSHPEHLRAYLRATLKEARRMLISPDGVGKNFESP